MYYKYVTLFMLMAIPILGISQQTIRGKVVSDEDEPLIGATVLILSTTLGTVTDIEGNFELAAVQTGSNILFSYVGYVSDTVQALFDKSMNVSLKTDAEKLDEVLIKGNSTMVDELKPIHNELITEKELLKAACCNLSESFETNASVDVSIADAVSGAKMIRMLGLDGRYVLISREGIPHIRGLASKYGLNYVPGTWIQSIDVGKGAGTVLNGYESMTG